MSVTASLQEVQALYEAAAKDHGDKLNRWRQGACSTADVLGSLDTLINLAIERNDRTLGRGYVTRRTVERFK